MTFCLDSIIIRPENGLEIKNAVILLHGYGGDGKDISMLSLNWKRHMPNTVFICPNGHEKCVVNPTGYQWFDLTKEDPSYILDQSIIAENKIKNFIEEIKKEFNLTHNQICLSGFSQGCMMSLNVGLTSREKFLCIVGFSGKIINQDNLKERINNSTDTLLIHGDVDQVVPSIHLLEAKDFLIRNSVEVETLLIKDCDHHIPLKASSTALNYILKKI
ncbi:alpha/beta hydrolase [Candidatus Pelagibacter bacterium nBUS_30]|jgi:phospholipase/carboxylesterase|uniref:alpha/beta hydrolase n=1 Tax=unclassified Candidatus Pelagibacter TaxID=2647897 RepID=UPI003EBB65A6|tara:strand:- start:122 stop:772 length:651 start_codon:yes stop_codon:yes gene_type:complete